MGLAKVELRDNSILKDFKDTDRAQYNKELAAYQELSWATPKLICHGEFWIEMERLTPILELEPAQSVKYREPLRALLQRMHDAGWWHGGCDLVNVVIHPTRGVLVVDFENITPSSGPISYDLYGARSAGVEPLWSGKGDDGAHWNGPSGTAPGRHWAGL